MVIRWGNSLGDKSDGYHLGREEGKPITPGIPGSEITAGSHRVLGTISEHSLAMWLHTHLVKWKNKSIISRGQLYCIAWIHFQPTTFSTMLLSERTFYNTDRHANILFLTKDKLCSQFPIANIYLFIFTEKLRYSNLHIQISIHCNICTNAGRHWVYITLLNTLISLIFRAPFGRELHW